MKDLWNGRFDSDEEIDLRIWQVIKSFQEIQEGKGIRFVGYDTDDGVSRNQGRTGAQEGSECYQKSNAVFSCC